MTSEERLWKLIETNDINDHPDLGISASDWLKQHNQSEALTGFG